MQSSRGIASISLKPELNERPTPDRCKIGATATSTNSPFLNRAGTAEAVERAERAVGLHADNCPLWELLGIAALCASMHDLAMSALTHAVRIDSAQPTGHKISVTHSNTTTNIAAL